MNGCRGIRGFSVWLALPCLTATAGRSIPAIGVLMVVAMLMSGCSSNRTVETQAGRRPSDPLMNHFAGNFQYGRDADGTMRVQSDQGSMFETGEGRNVQSRFNAREFSANEWRGSGQAARIRNYQGAEQQFRSSSAREQGSEYRSGSVATREQGAAAREQTRQYNTTGSDMGHKTAREAAVSAREAGGTARLAERAGDFQPAEDSRAQNHRPVMLDRETGQRRGYSPGQVQSLLGKDG